jgi:DNA-binding GntR family transcriptional regulator
MVSADMKADAEELEPSTGARSAKTPEAAYEALREAIITGRLRPNERLVEASLSEEFGIARAAVRVALVRLEQAGLVERERYRGAKVRLVSEEEAVEILEARAVLEALAVGHTATRATPDDVAELRGILAIMRERLDGGDLLGASEENVVLHRRLIELSGHQTVMRLIAMLNSQMVRFQYRTILVPGRSERSFGEHSAIVDAVESGDANAAETAMRRHIIGVTEALRWQAEHASARTAP